MSLLLSRRPQDRPGSADVARVRVAQVRATLAGATARVGRVLSEPKAPLPTWAPYEEAPMTMTGRQHNQVVAAPEVTATAKSASSWGWRSGRTRSLLALGVACCVAAVAIFAISGHSSGGAKTPTSAVLPFALETYKTQGVNVSRTWSLAGKDGTELHGELLITPTKAGPTTVDEVFPKGLVASADKIKSSPAPVKVVQQDPVLRFAVAGGLGSQARITYDVSVPAGPRTEARLQAWAKEQATAEAAYFRQANQPSPLTLASLAVSPSSLSLVVGDVPHRLQLSGLLTNNQPAAPNQLSSVKWQIDDSSVATVSADGIVNPLAPGAADVTARLGAQSAQAVVIVTDSSQASSAVTYQLPDGGSVTKPAGNGAVVVTPPPAHAPDAPSEVQANPLDGAAFVTWTVPSDGGAPILDYTVYANGDRVAITTSSGVKIGALTNGKSYHFTVVARNKVGAGSVSPESNAAVPNAVAAQCVPAEPDGVKFVPGTDSAAVGWQAARFSGPCTLRTYTVSATPGGARTVVPASSTTTTLVGLQPGTQYLLTVSADYENFGSVAGAPLNLTTTTVPKCADGSLQPANGKCPTPCPAGATASATGGCTPLPCPSAHPRGADGTCVVPPLPCPSGETQAADGSCSVVPLPCPSGETQAADGSCSVVPLPCPSGETQAADGSCSVVPLPCPSGETQAADGSCSVVPLPCPSGETQAADGSCSAVSTGATAVVPATRPNSSTPAP